MPENHQPVFSIITPTFRRPGLLERNIQSVINQSFKEYEHIIIDDADDSETESLVKRFSDSRIIYQKHEKPKGAAGGYNSGIKISRGRFILFLDDDDEYLPSFLEKMYNRFSQSRLNIGFIWAGISRVRDTEDGEEMLLSKIWPTKFPDKEKGLAEATSIGNGFGVCVRKECIDAIGLYDESLMIGEDTDFLFRLAQRYDFETIPEVLVKIHQHNTTQLTGDKFYLNQVDAKESILTRYSDFLLRHKLLYYTHYKAYADFCYRWNLKTKGRRSMFALIRKDPSRFMNFADLLFYEISGKSLMNFYSVSSFRKIIHFLKKNRNSRIMKTSPL
jgi:glycosyltransferase involved in cell wall biosynthesis